MLSYEEALGELLSRIPSPRIVRLPLEACGSLVLAETVPADMDQPPFRKSFVDGYAVRSRDTAGAPLRLKSIGEVRAGESRQPLIGPGETVRIMTGAPVPPQADAVQMVEKTRSLGEGAVECLEPVAPGENVAPQGSEVAEGETVLAPGRVLGAAELGVLATFGRSEVDVFSPPRASIIATGDELVPIGSRPAFGQIRNSNAYMLRAQCLRLGLKASIAPTVPDDRRRTGEAVREGLAHNDLLLFTGGVSMGAHDYVHQVLAEEGVDVLFHKAAIKPGKPLLAGRSGERLIFGLPGNPVSAFVTFELFVRPAVRKWMRFESCSPQRVRGELTAEVRQKPGRKFFKPARVCWKSDRFLVEPIETRGSADLVAFSPANALLIMEADASVLKAGTPVDVLLLADFSGSAR